MKNYLLLFLITFCSLNFIYCQNCTDLIWSTGERLTQDDFCIKIRKNDNSPSFAQFNIAYQAPGFGLFSNNFNKNVTNVLIREASWIDTTFSSIEESIRYQQILFDMAEIYCRNFRMELLKEKKKIALDIKYTDKINAKIMKEFSAKRAEFEMEYYDGKDENTKKKWEEWITSELNKLSHFDYNNSKKIKWRT